MKLVNLLSQILNSLDNSEIVIKTDEPDAKYVSIEEFRKKYKDLKNFEVIQVNKNELICRWEIRIKVKENNDVSK